MHADPDQIPEDIPVPPGEDTDDEPTPSLPVDPDPGAPERDPAVNSAEAANDPNVSPPEPVQPTPDPM